MKNKVCMRAGKGMNGCFKEATSKMGTLVLCENHYLEFSNNYASIADNFKQIKK